MSIGQKVVSSSLILVSVKVIQRSLGLLSTLILARLLLPEDFGIVAIAAITLQFATVLSNSGIQQYIPQKDQIDDEDINTAWSIDVLMKFIIWVLLFIGASFIADFYGNSKITPVIQVVSIVIFFRALQNPALHMLRRNLEYKPIFWLLTGQKLSSFVVVVSIAYFTHSYWAIIVGDLIFSIVGLIGSYYLLEYRPKFSLKKRIEQWAFTKWMLARGILGFFRSQLDNLMVSKMFTIGELGIYNVIRGISVLPATDIITPSVEPLLASFSKVKHDVESLDLQFRTSLLMIFILIMPICVVLASYSNEIVFVLLGKNWIDQGPLLANLTVLLFTFSIGSILGNFYIAIGKVKLIFFYNVLSLIFIFTILVAFDDRDLADFALLRGVLGLVTTSIWLLMALYFVKSNYLSFVLILIMPAIISFISLKSTSLLLPNIDSIYISLFINLFTLGALYVIFVILFYRLFLFKFKEWSKLKGLLFDAVRLRLH
jgi:lipopolysaccharide exporter